jgi:hypothetical protein
MKWGTKYGPEYVNRLYAMVRRHLTGDFRMVCLTDDPKGIRSEVQCLPIPPLDLPPGIPERGWTKLVTFSAGPARTEGAPRCSWMSTWSSSGSLDDFFDPARRVPGHSRLQAALAHHRQFVGVPLRTGRAPRCAGDISAATFDEVRARFPQRTGLPVGLHAHARALLANTGLRAWCPSFKYHGIPRWPTNYWKPPLCRPGARIVIFHGECNPPDALAGRRNRRFRFIKPATWVAEHWRE